ncbi:MAG: PstS family phosphate ABC transporter substrate-binding protein [Deltaproteobacteria bacterium]|nr:PstS family phosphate ABC transporter substrate-binding protein [Deltaproteobacteria bacterium]
MKKHSILLSLSLAVLALGTTACSKQREASEGNTTGTSDSKTDSKTDEAAIISIDGSSTVYPISEAVAEEFQAANKSARVTIGVSGTGGGFKKFCTGETDISNASRPIKSSEEAKCKEHGIGVIELPVAYDGIAVVVNPKNDWVDHLTVAELKKMWEPEAQGAVKTWSQIREGWPEKELHLFGPGVDSGTYDYFTKAIVGKEHSSRGDFTSSEDDNVLVQGVSTDELALGFFGFAYYTENKAKLKVVPIKVDEGAEAIAPSLETVANSSYQPLSRPIFIYVSKKSAERKAVHDLITFYLTEGAALSKEVGYIPLPQKAYELARERFAARTEGSVFSGASGGSRVGVSVEALLGGSED